MTPRKRLLNAGDCVTCHAGSLVYDGKVGRCDNADCPDRGATWAWVSSTPGFDAALESFLADAPTYEPPIEAVEVVEEEERPPLPDLDELLALARQAADEEAPDA